MSAPGSGNTTPPRPAQADAVAAAAVPIGSVHTANFPDLLRGLGGSLVVSAGRAGKLIILRPDGGLVGTHSIDLGNPVGMAIDGERLALAMSPRIVEFHNLREAAQRLHDPPRHDAVFLLRRAHVTGALDIREMAWDGQGELWFVSALLSSLCTLDAQSGVVPRWRPRFVSRCVPEDRCRLNGFGQRDGLPRYVTALGETDEPHGWRRNRHDGGVLVDVASGDVIARALSLPHSPRWYDGRLWVLESGRGALVTIDPLTGAKTDVARVPGFARGLDFLGPVAFVGLSQPREAATCDTVPANAASRSGVWAVHVGSGKAVARLEFAGAVPGVRAVQALPGVLFPEIVGGGELLSSSYALPPEALREMDPALYRPGEVSP